MSHYRGEYTPGTNDPPTMPPIPSFFLASLLSSLRLLLRLGLRLMGDERGNSFNDRPADKFAMKRANLKGILEMYRACCNNLPCSTILVSRKF